MSLTPAGAASLRKAGFGGVVVEAGAGAAARFAVRTLSNCHCCMRALLFLYRILLHSLPFDLCSCWNAKCQMLCNPMPFH